MKAINPSKILNPTFKEYFIYSVEDTSIASGTGTVFEDTIVRFDRDSNFEANKLIHVATDDRLYYRMMDNAYGRYYTNAKVDLRTISGKALSGITVNGFTPCILPAPLLIKGGTNLTYSFADFSGSANSVRLSMHGGKVKKGFAPWMGSRDELGNFKLDDAGNVVPFAARVPFFYTENFTVAANSTSNINISINYDADFLVHRLTAFRTGTALISIQDGSVDRSWMDKPVHIDNLFGNAQFPNMLSAPRHIKYGSVINISIQDLSGSSNPMSLTFIGEKLYHK